jgi:hypothetical protein
MKEFRVEEVKWKRKKRQDNHCRRLLSIVQTAGVKDTWFTASLAKQSCVCEQVT